MSDDIAFGEILFGTVELKPVVYTITTEERGRWWWKKTVYFVETEFVRIGPLTRDEAVRQLTIAKSIGCVCCIPSSLDFPLALNASGSSSSRLP